MPQDDSALCCCEYVNEEGERSHILAALCNCDALDEAFDRLITLKPVEERTKKRIWGTVADRLRIPWPGGAKPIPLDVFSAAALVPAFILLGCISWTLSFVSYVVILPVVVFSVHRLNRTKAIFQNTLVYGSDGGKHAKKYPRTRFFLAWLLISVVSLLWIYYTQVIAYLKISPYENLILLFFICVSCTCMYIVRVTSCAGFEPRGTVDEELHGEVIESGAWRICGECDKQVPRQASHCRTCDSCYLLRDHHCIWLDTCISYVNDRWFVVGLFFGLLSLIYGAHLSLTTVCHPRLFDLHLMSVLLPHHCPNAFLDFQSSLTISGSCYSILLGVLLTVALIQQLVCVVGGVRLREYRHRRQLPGQNSLWSLKYAVKNCFHFWWR